MPKPLFKSEKCKACELCVSVCPKKILRLGTKINNKGYNFTICINEADCIGCTLCAKMCPDAVIEIYK